MNSGLTKMEKDIYDRCLILDNNVKALEQKYFRNENLSQMMNIFRFSE